MDNNVYYNPAAFGLEVVAEFEYSDRCYQFDTRVIWRRKDTGQLLTVRDSGCSCPTPFEKHNLETLEVFNKKAIEMEILGMTAYEYYAGDNRQEMLVKLEKIK